MRNLIVSICFLAAVGCGGGGGEPILHEYAFASLGQLHDEIEAAATVDSDGDSIPDSIEALLGTDPRDRDTDRDGLIDSFELFGVDFDRLDNLPDRDNDGIIAPLDPDGLITFLQDCDLVKFARFAPPADETRDALGTVRQMVEDTVPRPADVQGPQAEDTKGQTPKQEVA